MPRRIRFYLFGDAPHNPFQHSGGLRALVFSWLDSSDSGLARALHDANQSKPFAVSPVLIEPGSTAACCFDVCVLVDSFLEPLLAGVRKNGDVIRLGRTLFRLGHVEQIAAADWIELLDARNSSPDRFDFQMLTPTALHSSGTIRKSIVVPMPELYFGCWFSRWNLCCEESMPDKVLEVINTNLATAAFEGSTVSVPLDRGRIFIGFKGAVRFALLKPELVDDGVKKRLLALAKFAEFCGTGVEAMRGMGQTHFLGE